MVHGWGGASLIELAELERKPVAVRNTIAARELAKRNGTIPTSPAMEEDNAEGEAARRRVESTFVHFRRGLLIHRFAARRALDGSPIIPCRMARSRRQLSRYIPSSILADVPRISGWTSGVGAAARSTIIWASASRC